MTLGWLATMAVILYAGGSLYAAVVEHPGRLACGAPIGIAHFRTSHRRQSWFLGISGLAGCGLAGAAALVTGEADWLAASAALAGAAALRGTLMRSTTRRLLDPELPPDSPEARALMRRWSWLQAVPTALGVLATAWLALRVTSQP